MSIEHHELKSAHAERRDDYTNCLLSCRFCNNSRGASPRVDTKSGGSLLDPTKIAWTGRFTMGEDFVMKPLRDDDADARWTLRSYRLDCPRKAKLRGNRWIRLLALREAEAKFAELVPELLREAGETDDLERKEKLIRLAQYLERTYENALLEASRYAVIPPDAPSACRCATSPPLELPSWLAEQVQDATKREALAAAGGDPNR